MAENNDKAPEKKKPVPPIIDGRLKLVGSSSADIGNQWAVVTPSGTPLDKVVEPEFWANVAHKLRAGDEITVHTDDMSYYARLYCRGNNAQGALRMANRATVELLEKHEFGPVRKDLKTRLHEVKWLGPHQKWCVVAIEDQRVLKDGGATSDEAYGHMRAIEAATAA